MIDASALEKVSIPEAVAKVVRRNYVLHEALRMKVVNYHALAARISPRVEELTGRRAKLQTVVVAIKRFSDRMEVERLAELETILDDASVTLTGRIVEITFGSKDIKLGPMLQKLLMGIPRLSTTPDVVMLPDVVKVLADREDGKLIKEEVGTRYGFEVDDKLARIRVRLARRAEKMPGVATFITELLYRSGVVVHTAYIGRPHILLIMDEKFGRRAYDVLLEATVAHSS